MGDYWVIPSAGGRARRLTFDISEGGAPAWMPDSRHILFPSDRTGSMILWKISVDGGTPEPITTGTGNDTDPQMSADGKTIIFTNTRALYSVEVFDPSTGEQRTILESRKKVIAPKFSPDGSKIAFFSGSGLFTVQPDGAGSTQITPTEEENSHPRWSPDGSSLYFYQFHPKPSFRKIPVEGGPSTLIADGWTWETEYGAEVSPDEKRVVYSGRKDGVITATRIRDLRTGGQHSLALPLDDPKWSGNGQEILGYDSSSRIWLCPADGSSCRKIVDGINPVWAPDQLHIYFQRKSDRDDGAELWTASLDGRNEKKVTELRPMQSIAYFYDVSRKNQIVWVRFQQGNQELWVMAAKSIK